MTSAERAARQAGFSLLEVMVAVAILAMALVSVFAASAGAVAATQHTTNIGVGTMMARCKMTELEQGMRLDGFQLDDVDEEGVCCEDEDQAAEGYTCHWKIEAVELPDVSAIQTAAGELSGGDPLGLSGPADAEGNEPGAEEGGIDDGMMAGINMLYPIVSNVLQASIRRVTVEVHWMEGEQQRTVKAVQFVTNPTQGVEAGKAPPPVDDVPEDGSGTGTGSGAGTGTGTGTGSGGTP